MSGPDSSSRDDVLQRAAAALRAAHQGQREGSGFTRARILATVAQRRRPTLWRWLVLAPLGSALLVGSAWAQSTGSWPRVWQAVAAVLPFVKPQKAHAPERQQRPAATRPVAPRAMTLPEVTPPAVQPPSEPPPSEPLAQPAAPPALEAPAPVLPGPPRTRKPAPSPPAAAAPDPELRRFRAAHELHVQGDARAALAAYEEYLQAYPSGRFVPEARYNSALDALKVGDHATARQLLEPFAAGAYGEYRRTEAQRLLEALRDTTAR